MSLIVIEPQPDFPHKDITEANRIVMEQLLCESSFINEAHRMSEYSVFSYKIGHAALARLTQTAYLDMEQQTAFSYGAAVYEVIALTVRPNIPKYNPVIALKRAEDIDILAMDGFKAAMALTNASERFSAEQPNAAKVIEFSHSLRPRFDQKLMLMGAAGEWEMEMDISQAS